MNQSQDKFICSKVVTYERISRTEVIIERETYEFGVFVSLRTLDELLLLAPIDKCTESGYNEDSQVNGGSVEPS